MKRMRPFLCLGLFFLLIGTAAGAPTLRLMVSGDLRQDNGNVQPVWIATGTNGPTTLFFEAWNQGDGSLNLEVSGGSSAWLKPELGVQAPCSFDAGRTCRQIRVLFESAALENGTYNGMVEVRDAGAVDAPQRVRIRIHVGGNVPERVDLFVSQVEGSTDSIQFQTPGGPSPAVSVTPAGDFLMVSSSGLGSIRSLHSHFLLASYRPGLPPGETAGTLQVRDSTFGADNRDVPVALNVTNDPIAQVSPRRLEFTTAEGWEMIHGLVQQPVVLRNRGAGALTVSGVEVETDAGDGWLAAEDQGDGVYMVTATVGALTANSYTGRVRFNTNAANDPVEVNVHFEVTPASGPQSNFSGLVDGASFSSAPPVAAPGAIVSLFGVQLAPSIEQPQTTPLPTTVATTKVLVDGIEAPLFFVSYQQLNLQVPFEVGQGIATVQVMRGDQTGNVISAPVAARSPGIFRWGIEEYGIITNFTQVSNFTAQTCPLPSNIVCPAPLASTPARPGDVLVLWSTGLGPVSPSVATGAAAPLDPLAQTDVRPFVRFATNSFASRRVIPAFAGLTPNFVGLFQVNVQVPGGLGTNPKLGVQLEFPDGSLSNVVDIAVQP